MKTQNNVKQTRHGVSVTKYNKELVRKEINNMNIKEIKDAARQAFRDQQSQDTEGGVPDAVSFIAGFVEGARYRQDEINELTSILDFKKETIVEMQNAYETLQAHDEMLIATVKKINLENEKLINALQFYAEYQNDNPDNEYNNELARQVLKEIGEE